MAGSLFDRRRAFGDNVDEIEVECCKLSDYLHEPIHFLKLDVEGAEDIVLTDSRPLLKNIQYIFCEYHQGLGLSSGRLGKILHLLNESGFEAQIGKSFNYQQVSKFKPMEMVERPYSAVIWAINLNWT
jgi:hypothetical protein